MAILYRTWLEFIGWTLTAVFWLFLLQDQVFWWQPTLLLVLFLVLYFSTRRLSYNGGAIPFVSVLILCGWLFLARLDPLFATGHFYGVVLGVLAFLIGIFTNFTQIERPLIWGCGAIVLLASTALFGQTVGGAKAWLTVFGLRFQPVELARIFLVIYVAQSLHYKRSKFEIVSFLGIGFLLLAYQRDLGPALLIFFVVCWLSLYEQFTWHKLLIYLASAIVGFIVTMQLFPHFRARAIAWLWPWEYLDSKGYQVLQGLFALRAGGAFGQGLGAGLVHVIPQGHTDYLLAIIGEELGFLGTFSILLTYFALAFWAFRILSRLADQRQQLTGLGLTLLLHGQIFMVVGGILRLVPFTGMTLPLVSYGSTSVVAQLWMLGMITGMTKDGGAS